ncbi:MAG: monofunctional biosynthetic peptidoglycan transglycosylase [Bacteroidales bacterium]|nr:monofunctional biosynthetic peptidoglycan transglycosylase [Bacteroidales bacterium]
MAAKKNIKKNTSSKGGKRKQVKLLKPWSSLSWWRRAWRVLWMMLAAIWLLSVLTVVVYRFVNPPLTPLMIQRFFQQYSDRERNVHFERDYVSISKISPNLVDAVVYSEDGLFMYHGGFDYKQIRISYEENKKGNRIRGGSTISQQTAKNAFLPHTRSMLRKALEAYFTKLIEIFWGKKRIMEVYLNIIEFGDGIYGCEAASQHYFGHSAATLTKREAAQLAVCLPAPLRMNPDHRGPFYNRQTLIVMDRLKWGRVDLDMPRNKRREGAKRHNFETFGDLMMYFVFGKKKDK